jgi:hypothetical protein
MLRTSLLPVPPPRAREHIDVATLPLPLDVMSLVLPLLPFQVCHPLRTYSLTRLPGVPPPSFLSHSRLPLRGMFGSAGVLWEARNS